MIKFGTEWNDVKNNVITFIVAFIVIIPSYVVVGAPNLQPGITFQKTAFLSNVDERVTVEADQRIISCHPEVPATMDTNIIELLQQLDESIITGYIENLTAFGPRVTGTKACNQTAQYLYTTFKNIGLSARYYNFTGGFATGSNIEATLYGADPTNIFIICAHYDSVYTGLGADDDGSGVAAVLAAAEIMSKYEFDHTIRFVCFSGEEQGIVGSCHYAQDSYKNKDHIVAVLNADMIGFATTPSDSIQGKIFENDASEWIVQYTQNISQIYHEYINIQVIPQGAILVCDHQFFWEYGYDAITYHEYHFNDYYHSSGDTIGHMNINYATRFSRLMLATLAAMANQPMNTPPIADAGLGQSVFTGEHVQLDGSDSVDGDGDPLTFTWSFINTPFGSKASIINPSLVDPMFTIDKSGTYVVQLIVNDGIIDSFPDTVSIYTQNRPPYEPNSPYPPTEATNVSITTELSWMGGDPDAGDTITYDVYFGSEPPFQKVASNISTPLYTPGILAHSLTYFWTVVAWDSDGLSTEGHTWFFTTIRTTNNPPNIPIIIGETNGKIRTSYDYTIQTSDVNQDDVKYYVDWGDNTTTITGLNESGEEIIVSHTWDTKGSYHIKVKAIDENFAESDWATLTVTMPTVTNVEPMPISPIFVFGISVDVKIVHVEPGNNYVDLEVLNKPLYIWENGIAIINPGAFVRFNEAKGLFLLSFPICVGICNDWGIIG